MEIVSSRTFDAPRETVFRAFAEPERLARWWGPNGFTNIIHDFNLRPGGAWRFVMRAPDGANYENVADFREVVWAEKIVFVHQLPVHRFVMTMTFAAAAGETTTLTWRMVFDPDPDNERLRPFIIDANEQNFDRLAAELGQMT